MKVRGIRFKVPKAIRSGMVWEMPPRMSYSELAAKYSELLYAVARKFPGETRHETALRYIQEVERAAISNSTIHRDSNTKTKPAK